MRRRKKNFWVYNTHTEKKNLRWLELGKGTLSSAIAIDINIGEPKLTIQNLKLKPRHKSVLHTTFMRNIIHTYNYNRKWKNVFTSSHIKK